MANPQVGDVLVSNPTATLDHDLSIVPNTPHVICPTHDVAVARGHELARDLGVDVWLTEDHTHFIKLGSYRDGGGRG
jgi:hypothetical protein